MRDNTTVYCYLYCTSSALGSGGFEPCQLTGAVVRSNAADDDTVGAGLLAVVNLSVLEDWEFEVGLDGMWE